MSRRIVAGLTLGLVGALSIGTGGRAEAQPAPIAVTGTITDATGGAVAGVLVTLSGATTATTTTDGAGTYSFSGLPSGGTFTVAPAQAGVSFTPGSRTSTNAVGNQTANFTATRLLTIAGRITDLNGTGLPGVALTLGGTAAATRVTDQEGRYGFPEVVEGGSYTVTPALALRLRARDPELRASRRRPGRGVVHGDLDRRRDVPALLCGRGHGHLLRHRDCAPQPYGSNRARPAVVPESRRHGGHPRRDAAADVARDGRSQGVAGPGGHRLRHGCGLGHPDRRRPHDALGREWLRQPRRDEPRAAARRLVLRRGRHDRRLQPVLSPAESRRQPGRGRDSLPAAHAACADRQDLHGRSDEPAHDLRER